MLEFRLNLFDGDGAGASAGTAATAAGGAQEGASAAGGVKVTTPDKAAQDARRAEFERLIKGEYKDLFAERSQQIIDRRFKETKQMEERLGKLAPAMELLSSKYGVAADDADALMKAITEDDSYYEAEAMERGVTVEQLKHIKAMERENQQLRAAAEERNRVEGAQKAVAEWIRQAEELKAIYPGFDLEAETGNERFTRLLEAGVDVRTAYEVVHHDDIIAGAMQFTAQRVQEKTVNDIRTRGLRPDEHGAQGQAPARTQVDISKLTRKEMDEYAARARRGERITFRE